MTIATMEELEALPVGSTVKVTGRRLGQKMYVRTEGGFTIDGVEVEPLYFAGHVAAGQVADYSKGDPESGDLFVAGSHSYIVLSVDDGIVWMMDFMRGTWRSTFSRPLTETRTFNWRRATEKPEWFDVAYALGTQMRAVEAESQRVATQWNEANSALNDARRDLLRMRQNRVAQIQVVATGVTRLPAEKALGKVPDQVTVVDVVASWRREFTVTSEPSSGCQCGTISREKVIELLGIEGHSEHADFGFQVDCGRH